MEEAMFDSPKILTLRTYNKHVVLGKVTYKLTLHFGNKKPTFNPHIYQFNKV